VACGGDDSRAITSPSPVGTCLPAWDPVTPRASVRRCLRSFGTVSTFHVARVSTAGGGGECIPCNGLRPNNTIINAAPNPD
jgi:hypothetical protein